MNKGLKVFLIILGSTVGLLVLGFVALVIVALATPETDQRQVAYGEGVDYDAFPDKVFSIYDDAIVYRFDEDYYEMTLSAGTNDDVEDVIDYYDALFEEEEFAIYDQQVYEDIYRIEGLFIEDGINFRVDISEAYGKREKDHYATQFQIVLSMDDGSKISQYDYNTKPLVHSFEPSSGPKGTLVTIKGQDLDSGILDTIAIGNGLSYPVKMTAETISFVVPSDASSGDIVLNYKDEPLSVGSYTVEALTSELLVSENVGESQSEQIIKAEGVTVTLPPGLLDQNRTLEIKTIDNFGMANLANTSYVAAYDITIDDVHEFEDYLTIEMTLPEDMEGYPAVLYYDESSAQWVSAEYEVTDQDTVMIYSDHLTFFIMTDWTGRVYSSEGNFVIYYDIAQLLYMDYASIKDMAIAIGEYLEEAKATMIVSYQNH